MQLPVKTETPAHLIHSFLIQPLPGTSLGWTPILQLHYSDVQPLKIKTTHRASKNSLQAIAVEYDDKGSNTTGSAGHSWTESKLNIT